MSFHAQLSPEAEARLRAQRRQSNLAAVGISILVVVLLGLVLAFVVFQPLLKQTPVIVSYSSASNNEEQLQEKKQTTSHQNKPSAPSPTMAKVIAANVASPTAVPVPDVAVPQMSLEFGNGDDFGDGWGQSGDGGGATAFGSRSGSGLTGTFIDLKQTQSGEPTDMKLQPDEADGSFRIDAPVNQRTTEILGDFVRSGMDESKLARFFHAPRQLYLRQLYVPTMLASEAPRAFEVDDRVQGRRWVVVYRGTVVPPESGRYRFVGFSDDVLVVRFDGELVLDASLAPPTNFDRGKSHQHANVNHGWQSYIGKTFNAPARIPREIEIMTGEGPGGHFSSYLLLDKVGEDYEKDSGGAPKLPLFKLGPSPVPPIGQNVPDLGEDRSWSVWGTQS